MDGPLTTSAPPSSARAASVGRYGYSSCVLQSDHRRKVAQVRVSRVSGASAKAQLVALQERVMGGSLAPRRHMLVVFAAAAADVEGVYWIAYLLDTALTHAVGDTLESHLLSHSELHVQYTRVTW